MMTRWKTPNRLVAVGVMLALLALASSALAQTGGGYDLTWSTIGGGGATFSSGGDYTLGGAIGQPDAGTLSGGDYTLDGGFWGVGAAEYRIYLPLVLRSSS
jgi:hypothetical protein